jgi:hypothetical protein
VVVLADAHLRDGTRPGRDLPPATTRRAQPTRTMGELVVVDGRCVERRIIDLGP